MKKGIDFDFKPLLDENGEFKMNSISGKVPKIIYDAFEKYLKKEQKAEEERKSAKKKETGKQPVADVQEGEA